MSKEILCPVCGTKLEYEGTRHTVNVEKTSPVYSCQNSDCTEFEKVKTLSKILKKNALIQSRIDRAVEEAVRVKGEEIFSLVQCPDGCFMQAKCDILVKRGSPMCKSLFISVFTKGATK